MTAPPNFEESQSANRPQRFQKMVRKNGGIPKKESSSRNLKGNDYCHKCGKPGHFIKVCPFLKQEHYKHNTDKEPDTGSSSMMDVKNETKEYDSLFALMAQSNEDENDDNDELGDAEQYRDDLMVVVVDLKETIENLSKEKNTLVEKIAATEQERDDMVVSIADLRE
uniref:Uncharacterized protein LOC104219347 n=1 Tax=Nicotiana sylvestris TaxID=4096 RepID=A0A1U7VPJ6_NICSY|nr:PREDICTED: uncharacterized protein LOC104219347 [Nicotiana sylvestris]